MQCSAVRGNVLVLAGELEDLRQTADRTRTQLSESQQRERVLMRRLTAKEQETQDYVVSSLLFALDCLARVVLSGVCVSKGVIVQCRGFGRASVRSDFPKLTFFHMTEIRLRLAELLSCKESCTDALVLIV